MSQIGQQMVGNLDYYKAAWKKEQEIRAAEAKADDLPRVLLKTNKGEIEIELFENEAPNSTANFIALVEKGFYNGVVFHRVLPQFMAQGGDPTGTGSGGPGYVIPCECYQPNHRLHFRGTLSMAHAGRDTGGSQFFLTFLPTRHLDGKHTAFGRVVKGMDVLPKLQRRNPEQPEQPEPDKIVEAKVLRKRPHAYAPKTLPDPR
jgi:cyclophilin family peptidyl-prolyl cis-trans isomerase